MSGESPDWAKDEATIIWAHNPGANALIDAISQALAAVDQRAYARGIEEAAKVAEMDSNSHSATSAQQTAEWHRDTGIKVRTAMRIATAIRQLLEVKG